MRIALLALVLAGCATNTEQMRLALDAQAKLPPTLEMTCPNGGCKLTYTDPRDRQAVKLPTNGWDTLNTAISAGASVLQGAVVPAAFAAVAVKGFDAHKGSGAVTTNTTTTTTTNDTTTTTNTLSGTGTLGSGAYTATTTTTTDDHSATATPTVVTQPTPIIVTQPAPVIVGP